MNQKQIFNPKDIADAVAYIETYWPKITRFQKTDEESLISLPFPYIIPSSDTSNGFVYEEMYYWDSYFTAQGLHACGLDDLAEGMLENLLFLLKKFGFIPNSNRYYHFTHSQPPFLTSYIFDIFEWGEKSDAWLKERITLAEREYHNVWTNSLHPHFRNVYSELSRYYDIHVLDDLAEAESGWDMTTRFNGKCLDYLPIDLNCLLYKYEKDFAKAYRIFGDEDSSELWESKAQFRKENINKLMFNNKLGYYFDYNYKKHQQSKVWSLAGMYALWSGLASAEQAESIMNNLKKFVFTGGLVATTSKNKDKRKFEKQWAYPNAWAPLQWLSITGIINYGFKGDAEYLARLWIGTNLNYYKEFGIFREAYNAVKPLEKPLQGVYPSQIGFGWTNAIFVDLCKKYLSAEELQLI